MGTSTFPQFVAKVERAQAEMVRANRTAITNAAKVMQKAATERMQVAAPGGHLRNVKNSRLSVSVKVTGAETSLSATVKANGGAYAILDEPTKGHLIGAGKSTKKAKGGIGPARPGKRSGSVLKIGQAFVTGPIHHPGTHGKHTFKEATTIAQPAAVKAYGDAQSAVIKGVFG